jgi:uncharacterized protein YegL
MCFFLSECDTPVELGFLVDRSGSISKQDFEKVKSFVLTVIGGFDVSKKGTHIGIISYSSDAKTIISFNQFDDSNFDYGKLNDTIRDGLASPEGGTTRIDLALEKADQELFSDITKYRSFVPKVRMLRNVLIGLQHIFYFILFKTFATKDKLTGDKQ